MSLIKNIWEYLTHDDELETPKSEPGPFLYDYFVAGRNQNRLWRGGYRKPDDEFMNMQEYIFDPAHPDESKWEGNTQYWKEDKSFSKKRDQ